MKNIEKERLATNAVISSVFASVYAIGMYLIYDGLMNRIPQVNVVNYLSIILAVIGITAAVITRMRKQMTLFWYAISLIVYGGIIKLLEYGLISSNIPFGKPFFFAYEALTALYIIFIIIFTLIKVRK